MTATAKGDRDAPCAALDSDSALLQRSEMSMHEASHVYGGLHFYVNCTELLCHETWNQARKTRRPSTSSNKTAAWLWDRKRVSAIFQPRGTDYVE